MFSTINYIFISNTGGGYSITLIGAGFSSSTIVLIDENNCNDLIMSNFSSITCTVPPTMASETTQVSVVIIDGSNSVTALTQFTYNVTDIPQITSVNPSFVSITGGQLTIDGTNFGTDSVSVTIGTTNTTIVSITSTEIIVNLPSLPPGMYPIIVATVNGYAHPIMSIEYRFYVQNISPQVGSLYGGSDIYIQGEGFDNSSIVTFIDDDDVNNSNNDVSCNIISIQSTLIHCQTDTAISPVIITANGTDPINGYGFAWSPTNVTIQQGTIIEWQWNASAVSSINVYKVQQVANDTDTEPVVDGFDSGNASLSGRDR